MSLLSPSLRLLGIVAVSTVAVAACSSSDANTGPSNDLAGTYSLSSFEAPPIPALTPPTVSGTLVLTATRYKATLNIPGVPAVDSGTYTTSGNTLTQTSDVLPVQSVGTYTLTGNQLVTDVTTAGTRVKSTWLKQ